MQRVWAALGSTVFFVIAPGTILGLVPWWITGWRWQPAFLGTDPTRAAGALLLAAGLLVLVESFVRFVVKGVGTPAPVYPARHLVTGGYFRYVRNPIYVALLVAILGQALIFADSALLLYAALLWIFFHLFVRLYEEPTLRQTFGEDYETYCAHVPRWLPRITPWSPDVTR